MKTIKEIDKQIEELQRQKQELLNNDYEEYKHKDKTFRIYKLENKRVKDFIYPKGFRMSEFQEFVDLLNSKKYKLEHWKYYFVKHFYKLQWDKPYCLSRLFANDGNLYAWNGNLADSDDDGRVVAVK